MQYQSLAASFTYATWNACSGLSAAQVLDSDRAAFMALLARLGQTVVENEGSEHAGYVVDLIGKVRGGRSESQ